MVLMAETALFRASSLSKSKKASERPYEENYKKSAWIIFGRKCRHRLKLRESSKISKNYFSQVYGHLPKKEIFGKNGQT